MKKHLIILLFLGLFCISATAQKIGKPTLEPSPPTPEQKQLIQEGIRLHDAKKYDEAIAAYQAVLKENPNCALAIYEMALSYYNKKDFDKTLEAAYKL
ncbi:MAG: tetratricopeptide repeat protein, partial [Aridibacter sp.]